MLPRDGEIRTNVLLGRRRPELSGALPSSSWTLSFSLKQDMTTKTRAWHTDNGSLEICIEDDAVARLARFEVGQRFIHLAHREVFDLRRDLVPRGEVEHRR